MGAERSSMSIEYENILEDLRRREPIFHRREFGTSRDDLLRMTDEEFWEIGASGKIYTREFVIANSLERYEQPEPHDWPCEDFSISELAENLYQINYILKEPDRTTRRTTLWRKSGGGWKIVFHQGTVIA
ncbi:DUF4440 domain-containing protein [Rhizobium pisi]|nr:DUF4440 domain-containing protein [Rhizobium pisi]